MLIAVLARLACVLKDQRQGAAEFRSYREPVERQALEAIRQRVAPLRRAATRQRVAPLRWAAIPVRVAPLRRAAIQVRAARLRREALSLVEMRVQPERVQPECRPPGAQAAREAPQEPAEPRSCALNMVSFAQSTRTAAMPCPVPREPVTTLSH
jgi:hypothetical protein